MRHGPGGMAQNNEYRVLVPRFRSLPSTNAHRVETRLTNERPTDVAAHRGKSGLNYYDGSHPSRRDGCRARSHERLALSIAVRIQTAI
jgi:hypothetical protein